MALSVDTHRGLVLLAAVPYDDAIIDLIRTLPERHYRPREQAWCVPARREQLRHVSTLIGELDERDVAVDISDSASARLARADIGRAILRGDVIEITGPYSPRRLPALRALPERRFDATRRTWDGPAHTRRSAGDPRPRRSHQRTRRHPTRTPRATTDGNPHRLHAARQPRTPSNRSRPDATTAHRAVAPLHARTDLREPRPREDPPPRRRPMRARPRGSALSRRVRPRRRGPSGGGELRGRGDLAF